MKLKSVQFVNQTNSIDFSSFFMTYTLKNTLQFVISVAYLIWMIITSNGSVFLCEDGKCDIVNYRACKLARVSLIRIVYVSVSPSSPHNLFYIFFLIFFE